MGTDSSGLPLCEPGTHDHGGSAFVPATRGLQFCLFPSMLLRCGRAGERGKVFRNHFAATTSFQESGYAMNLVHALRQSLVVPGVHSARRPRVTK